VRRFFDRVQPRLLVLMETELWPNLIAEAARRDVPVVLVNARLSERSARGYGRLGGLVRDMLRQVRAIACQYPDHARRFVALGAPSERVQVTGSVKFDLTLPQDHGRRVAALRARWGLDGPVWIAASTHPGEEALVLSAHERVRAAAPGARLILVPRHPARADEVVEVCRQRGLAVARQSEPAPGDAGADVLLGDVMGELLYLYGLAGAAFVGGSLVRVGGHNPIEPAVCGVPVVMGPHVFNFPDVVEAFRDAGCLVVVAGEEALAAQIAEWLADPEVAGAAGRRAEAVVARQRGATARLETLLTREIEAAAGIGIAAADG
jgi:3-deoxy-D-manno-octulosonic-acid transferase